MNRTNTYSRRRFLTQMGLGTLAFAATPNFLRAMEGMQAMPKLPPNKANPAFKPDVDIDLYCRSNTIGILPGQASQVFQYTAKLGKGPAGTLVDIPQSYLGPLIHLQKGQKVRINLHNQLPEPSVTHWHGLHVPAQMDGHPQYVIDPGASLVYEFEVLNRAGMNIYHPHPHEATARQVYQGLAGALFVHDEEEARLELPSGEFEIPLVIQDRLFDAQNQLVYVHSRHDQMTGFFGDRILVNGRPDTQLELASRAYRLRILNGSNARIYKLAWDDGTPITVLGVDGGLLEKPEVKPYVMLAPGERLDVWADFSGRNEGTQLTLRSLEYTGVLPAMAARMGGMMHANRLPVGSNFPILTVRITQKVSDSPKLPAQLSHINWHPLNTVANREHPLPIGISEGPMAMQLNGRPYAFNDTQPFERIKVNTIQLMEIFHAHGGHAGGHGGMGMGGMRHDNSEATEESHGMGMGGMGMGMMGGRRRGGQQQPQTDNPSTGGMGSMGGMGMMMSMAHPIHLHGQQFQILSRSTPAASDAGYASVRDGFIDSGLKDTVLVMPGETVRIIKPFQDFKGLFMYHCHNLEHEDMGMMRDFLIE